MSDKPYDHDKILSERVALGGRGRRGRPRAHRRGAGPLRPGHGLCTPPCRRCCGSLENREAGRSPPPIPSSPEAD